MPNSIKLIAAFFLCTLSASAQVTVGGNVRVGGNSVLSGTTSGGGGTSVTVNLGGTAVNTAAGGTDTGNALFPLVTPFVTPATMSSPSWGNLGIYWSSPDSTNKNWGTSLWSDAPFTGTVNTQNATSGSCTSNCLLVQSGNNFVTSWSPSNVAINVNGQIYQCTIKTTTLAQCNTAPGTQTGVTYTVHTPGTLLCSTFSSTVVSAGWNNPTITSCGTPTTNTWYWVGGVTVSNTQAFSRPQGNRPCDNVTGSTSWGTTLSSFTSAASWGTVNSQTFASLGTAPGFAGDGCISITMALNYTTTDAYTILTAAAGGCDSVGTTCVPVFPATQAGSKMLVFEESSNTGIPCSTPSDPSSDTFTVVGTPVNPITGGAANHSQCWYYSNSITTGTTQVTCNFAAANKQVCTTLEIKGTSAVDQNCYDSAFSTSSPYTGCSTGTTTQASEIVISSVDGANDATAGSGWNVQKYTPGSGWTYVLNGCIIGNSPYPFGIFMKLLSSTGTPSLTSSSSPDLGGSNSSANATVTLK